MTAPNTTGVIGVTNDAATTAAQLPLGTVVLIGNTSYTQALAASALAAAATTNLTGGFATTVGATFTHDVPAPGVASGQYFWARRVVTAL
jgi:hypothetical protein